MNVWKVVRETFVSLWLWIVGKTIKTGGLYHNVYLSISQKERDIQLKVFIEGNSLYIFDLVFRRFSSKTGLYTTMRF